MEAHRLRYLLENRVLHIEWDHHMDIVFLDDVGRPTPLPSPRLVEVGGQPRLVTASGCEARTNLGYALITPALLQAIKDHTGVVVHRVPHPRRRVKDAIKTIRSFFGVLVRLAGHNCAFELRRDRTRAWFQDVDRPHGGGSTSAFPTTEQGALLSFWAPCRHCAAVLRVVVPDTVAGGDFLSAYTIRYTIEVGQPRVHPPSEAHRAMHAVRTKGFETALASLRRDADVPLSLGWLVAAHLRRVLPALARTLAESTDDMDASLSYMAWHVAYRATHITGDDDDDDDDVWKIADCLDELRAEVWRAELQSRIELCAARSLPDTARVAVHQLDGLVRDGPASSSQLAGVEAQLDCVLQPSRTPLLCLAVLAGVVDAPMDTGRPVDPRSALLHGEQT
jgi:hypothetical protein